MALLTADPRLARFTTNRPPVPAETTRALASSGRAVATEYRTDEVELARGTGDDLDSGPFADLFRGEQPVRATAPRGLAPATVAATQSPPLTTREEAARESAGHTVPEKPRHSWILKGSTNPFAAAVNRTLRKRVAARLGRPAEPVLLAGGVNPIDHANGLTTPNRGRVNVNHRSARPGTPTPILTAPDDVVSVSKSATPAALGRGTVDGAAESGAAGSGGGLTQLAFLAGAVFVAWLALK